MKITATQLKQIIAEEIKRAVMNEAGETGLRNSDASQTMLDVVCDGWKLQFNSNDPIMNASGNEQVWEAQCETACKALGKKIEELIMQVKVALVDGRFYSERSMP